MNARSTIHDVAREAGVSIATVSRVINDPAQVRAETVDTVRSAMKTLRYRPNVNGRRLKTATSRSVGVLVPSLGNPVFADSVSGIEQAARDEGLTLLLTTSNYDSSMEDSAIATLLSNRVDGLILTVADADGSGIVKTLRQEGLPFVLLFNQPQSKDISAVSVDNAEASADITRRLLRLGHRRLAMVAGEFASSDRSRLRYEGFSRALGEAGIAHAPLLEVGFADTSVSTRLKDLLTTADRPTALVCSNDMLAIATIRGCRDLGLRVPEDVSVVGFDGVAVGELVQPSLDTVVQPTREMGRQAFALLLGLIRGEAKPQCLLLPHCLREGESVGVPPR